MQSAHCRGRVQSAELTVYRQSAECRDRVHRQSAGPEHRVNSAECRVQRLAGRVQSAECRVQRLAGRAQSARSSVQVQSAMTECRAQEGGDLQSVCQSGVVLTRCRAAAACWSRSAMVSACPLATLLRNCSAACPVSLTIPAHIQHNHAARRHGKSPRC